VWAQEVVVGDPSEFVLATRQPVTPCVWNAWTDWSECTAICNGGTQNRSRTDNGFCINYSIDPYFESQDCNTAVCCEVSDWSDWLDCDCTGQQKRIRIITKNGVACPPTTDYQNCTKPPTCVTPVQPTPVVSPGAPPTPVVGPTPVKPPTPTTGTKLLSFDIVGSGDTTAVAAVVASLLEKAANITPGSISVVVTPTDKNGMYTVTVNYSGDKSKDVISAAESDSFANSLDSSTGLTVVPGSLSVADQTPSPDEAPLPYWVWIIIGAGCFLVIAIVIAIIAIHFASKQAELV
jgi:hypothetical protein